MLSTQEIILRVVVSVCLGATIGLERQWRARMAGLRTNALVSTGSTLFVLLSGYGFSRELGNPDPTRVAAQIVSGIGFLGAGVIMRDGLNVRGLNTAATLWCSAALGALSGTGQFREAIIGAIAVLIVNIGFRSLARLINKQPLSGVDHEISYLITITANEDNEAEVRDKLVNNLVRTDFHITSLDSSHARTVGNENLAENEVVVKAEIQGDNRDNRQVEATVNALSLESAIRSVRWQVINVKEEIVSGNFTTLFAARK